MNYKEALEEKLDEYFPKAENTDEAPSPNNRSAALVLYAEAVILHQHRTKELIDAYEEYIKLFEEENSNLMGLNIAHGYTGNEVAHQKGIKARERIETAKSLN